MVFRALSKMFGNANDRKLKHYNEILQKVNNFEAEIQKLSNDELKLKKDYFKLKLKNNLSLNDILPEAFAVVREASKRLLGMRHFDVQIIGGIVLHEGKIAEMKTGEGKTLVATLPVYLNALLEKGVHVVTANDYLVSRDAHHMGKLYEFLGMSVGCVTSFTPPLERKNEYYKDITYATNNELGFDYLRDNMKMPSEETCLINRGSNFAIVDEIDSILIDEARTPLIISGIAQSNISIYKEIDELVKKLSNESYEIDEKNRTVTLTENGYDEVEKLLKIFQIVGHDENIFHSDDVDFNVEKTIRNSHLIHMINQALKAHKIFRQDVDYLIQSQKVMIIDEFTGRIMDGRRYSDGQHQALEAKHGLEIQPETQTLASITYQNYFRQYSKLAGMTGTADTEVDEFIQIYGLDVVVIPTNKPIARQDIDDSIYKTEREKFNAIVEIVTKANEKGQPVLIGTASVDKSEKLADLFKKCNLQHNVLNAKYHEKEAEIIADAGRKSAITIATNMAGRGTDIMLGGNLEKKISKALRFTTDENEKKQIIEKITEEHKKEEQDVKNSGGLFVIGSERHESRRIDNQLRGRGGRQGDVGKSQFFLSLEDDLLRIFGGGKIDAVLSRLGFKEGESIEHPWLNKVLANAQKRVEQQNFEIRKNLIKFDDVMNNQRKIIYEKRYRLSSDNQYVVDEISDLVSEELKIIEQDITSSSESSDPLTIEQKIKSAFSFFNITYNEDLSFDEKNKLLTFQVNDKLLQTKTHHLHKITDSAKYAAINALDLCWKEHLYKIDGIKSGIHLRSFAGKDPLNEYKIEVFEAFEEMLAQYRLAVVRAVIDIIS